MKFKDLKSGFPLYILDKNNMTFLTEKVSNVSMPHIDAKLTATGMVVDVTTDGATYCVVADSEVAYPQNKVITTDRQNILREVEAMKATSESVLSQVDTHRQLVTKCNQLIADLDPAQKEKQATEARFSNLENSMEKMMSMLSKLTEQSSITHSS